MCYSRWEEVVSQNNNLLYRDSIKASLEAKNKDLYNKINDFDHISKELKIHKHC